MPKYDGDMGRRTPSYTSVKSWLRARCGLSASISRLSSRSDGSPTTSFTRCFAFADGNPTPRLVWLRLFTHGRSCSSAMRVLVTGSDGYIGSVLGPYLGERGFDVVGVDTGFYRDAALYDAASARILRHSLGTYDTFARPTLQASTPWSIWPSSRTTRWASSRRRSPTTSTTTVQCSSRLRRGGASSVLSTHRRAACTALPTKSLSTRTPHSIRRRRTPTVTARRARRLRAGVGRLLADIPSQRHRLRRLPPDALRHRREQPLWARVDHEEIRVESDGTPWRPLVHVLDICRAIADVLDSPRDVVHGVVLNVGDRDATTRSGR